MSVDTPSLESASPGPEPALECLLRMENLTVRYGDNVALSSVNLSLRTGDCLGIIGPNGAGKTTLLRVLLGLVAPSEGQLITATPAPRVGYVPQRLGFDMHFPLTVEEFLAINHPGRSLWLGGVPRSKRAAIERALDQVGAVDFRRQRLGTLSGGQLQRVLVGAALLQKPQLLLLDEPSAGIDHRGSEELLELLRELRKQSELTLIFVSHDLHLLSGLADTVACLNGSLCGLGPPEEILQEHLLGNVYGGRHLALAPYFRFPASSAES